MLYQPFYSARGPPRELSWSIKGLLDLTPSMPKAENPLNVPDPLDAIQGDPKKCNIRILGSNLF